MAIVELPKNLNFNYLTDMLLEFRSALLKKAEKISSNEDAYKLGVVKLPRVFKSILDNNLPSDFWAFEGSVGRGTWSRTPWIAIYDTQVTSRASDGFFVAMIVSEDKKSIFLTLMNSSMKHYSFIPFRLNESQVQPLINFNLGKIPRYALSESGRGTGPDFESSTLLWKKYDLTELSISNLSEDFILICSYYKQLATSLLSEFPKEKPFKNNPFLLKV